MRTGSAARTKGVSTASNVGPGPTVRDTGADEDIDAVDDALRHVLLDAFGLDALARLAVWNLRPDAPPGWRRLFENRARSCRRAQSMVAHLMIGRRGAATLHPSDPPEIPRAFFAEIDDEAGRSSLRADTNSSSPWRPPRRSPGRPARNGSPSRSAAALSPSARRPSPWSGTRTRACTAAAVGG